MQSFYVFYLIKQDIADVYPVLPCVGVKTEISVFVPLNDNGPSCVGHSGRQLHK